MMMLRVSISLWMSLSIALVSGNSRCFTSRDELISAVDTYIGLDVSMANSVKSTYGDPMNKWCVKLILDFTEVFSALRNPQINVAEFNENLNDWDTRNANTMNKMFDGAIHFNGLISQWDVSQVTSMSNMFSGCEMFDRDLANWDTGNVKHMEYMFDNHPGQTRFSFNGNIGTWDVSKVWSMKGMFRGAKVFNQDLSQWDTTSLTSTKAMFEDASRFDGDIGDWDVSGVGDMRQMFKGASSYTGKGLYKWNTSQSREMNEMFAHAKSLTSMKDETADLSAWKVGNVKDISAMFQGCENFNADLSLWDVGKVSAMGNIFKDATAFEQDLCSWGYTIHNVQQEKKTEDQDYVVELHGIFKNTSCAEHLDPIIGDKLSRGFCIQKCNKESAYQKERAEYGKAEKKKGNNVGTIILYLLVVVIVVMGVLMVVNKVVNNPHRGHQKVLGGNDANPSFFGANAEIIKENSERANHNMM